MTASEAGAAPHCKVCLPTDAPICSRLPAPNVSVPRAWAAETLSGGWHLLVTGQLESVLAVEGDRAGLLQELPGSPEEGQKDHYQEQKIKRSLAHNAGPQS